jgi:hypothetical protein
MPDFGVMRNVVVLLGLVAAAIESDLCKKGERLAQH